MKKSPLTSAGASRRESACAMPKGTASGNMRRNMLPLGSFALESALD